MPRTERQVTPETTVARLGEVIQLDHTVAENLTRIDAETGERVSVATKDSFLGMVNNEINESMTNDIINPFFGAKGDIDSGSYTKGIYQKQSKLKTKQKEDVSSTTNASVRIVRMLVQEEVVTDANSADAYRIKPSRKTKLYDGEDLSAANADELNAHILFQDRLIFSRLSTYARENVVNVSSYSEDKFSSAWWDKVLDTITEKVALLKNGKDFSGVVPKDHAPIKSNDGVIVKGTYDYLLNLGSRYMTKNGSGSVSQYEEFKNGRGNSFMIGGITYQAVPEVNMIAEGDLHDFNGTLGSPKMYIVTTGKFSPVSFKNISTIHNENKNLGYGDIVVYSDMMYAVTGTDYNKDNGEIYKNHVFAFFEEDTTTVTGNVTLTSTTAPTTGGGVDGTINFDAIINNDTGSVKVFDESLAEVGTADALTAGVLFSGNRTTGAGNYTIKLYNSLDEEIQSIDAVVPPFGAAPTKPAPSAIKLEKKNGLRESLKNLSGLNK